MKQPEALRLADALEAPLVNANDIAEQAAAELRRLHAQRDALLEALRLALPYVSAHLAEVGDMDGYNAEHTAQTAIAAVYRQAEGEKE